MLDDLHRGVAAISLLQATKTTMELASIDFSAADQVFTIKDTFSINQEDPEVSEIKIDQGNATIDTDVEVGEFNISGNIPSTAQALFDFFYETAGDVTGVKGTNGATYSGKGYFNTPKDIRCTVLIESASRKTAVVFANMKLSAVMVQDDMSNPLYLKFTGTVLTNTVSGKGDFAILKAATA